MAGIFFAHQKFGVDFTRPTVLPTETKRNRIRRSAGVCGFPRLVCNNKPCFAATYSGAASSQASLVCERQQVRVNFYDVLGVALGSSDAELKNAYRRMVKQYHPDHAPPDKAEEYRNKFMEVYRAYNILKDPKRRSIHDFEIKNSLYNRHKNYNGMVGQWRGRNWETDQCWTS